MRTIKKVLELVSLKLHRMTPHSDFDNYTDKDALRQALVNEQHGLCCYCMDRIHPERQSMKIEHWRSRSSYPDSQLDYSNLLGTCLGGEGQPARYQHCDTKKGDRNLKWNPSNREHHVEARVWYKTDGSIRSDDVDFNCQIDDVLNLNFPELMNSRKYKLYAVLDWWKHERARTGGPVPRELLVRKRDEHATGNGQLSPYCQVAVWWLDQRLARMAT